MNAPRNTEPECSTRLSTAEQFAAYFEVLMTPRDLFDTTTETEETQ